MRYKDEEFKRTLFDRDGAPITTFDFGNRGLRPSLAKALRRADEACFGHTDVESQKQSFRGCLKLIRFLVESDLAKRRELPSDTAGRLHNWLSHQELKDSTKQSLQNIALILLKWLSRNIPKLFASTPLNRVPSFSRETPPRRGLHLDEASSKVVLGACYDAIEAIEKRLSGQVGARQKISEADQASEQLWSLCGDKVPTQNMIIAMGKSSVALLRTAGGIGELRRQRYLMLEDLTPFYVAIVIQTMGNPGAIIRISRKPTDVIFPHPLRTDTEYFRWYKPRAGAEQSLDFPVGKAWSAPNIFRRLINLNSGIVRHTRRRDNGCAFIGVSAKGMSIGVPSTQTLHNNLEAFIRQYSLPNFDFRDWRPTGGKAHRRVAHTVKEAQRKLNHKDPRTTARYTPPDDDAEYGHLKIVEFQGEMVRRSRTNPTLVAGVPIAVATEARTVFGFKCQNPFAGFNSSAPKGKICDNFTGCAGCHGALVVIDDPENVGAILSTKVALEDAERRALRQGWVPRFNAFYAPTLAIIKAEILPKISEAILLAAQRYVDPKLIPHLE